MQAAWGQRKWVEKNKYIFDRKHLEILTNWDFRKNIFEFILRKNFAKLSFLLHFIQTRFIDKIFQQLHFLSFERKFILFSLEKILIKKVSKFSFFEKTCLRLTIS